MKTINKFLTLALLTILTGSIFSACSTDTITPQADNLDVSFMSTTENVDNSAVLVLDTVKILIKDIKLNGSGSGDTNNFKVGPYVLNLNLNSSVNTIGSGFIPEGTYDKIMFEIHKLNDNEVVPDPDFADSLGRYSVVAKGTYNGVRFVYKSSKSAKQKINTPSTVGISTIKTNVTLNVKPYYWFFENGDYLDPTDPANENDIDNNIKESFKAFKDHNKDGIPD